MQTAKKVATACCLRFLLAQVCRRLPEVTLQLQTAKSSKHLCHQDRMSRAVSSRRACFLREKCDTVSLAHVSDVICYHFSLSLSRFALFGARNASGVNLKRPKGMCHLRVPASSREAGDISMPRFGSILRVADERPSVCKVRGRK